MMPITISAMTLEEAELMLKILDKHLRRVFNTYGVKRCNSWNRYANDGIRAQITGRISREMWETIKRPAIDEMVNTLLKAISYEVVFSTVIDLSTKEAEI